MRYIPFTNQTINLIPQFGRLPVEKRHELEILSRIFHFKTNNYVVNELIDWEHYTTDPLFLMNFPRKEMLDEYDFTVLSRLLRKKSAEELTIRYIENIRMKSVSRQIPRPPDFIETIEPKGIAGLHHRFPETLMVFTTGAATCHAYCTYCYRRIRFMFDEIRFEHSDPLLAVDYLRSHPGISDILFTGGDALHMRASELKKFILPLLEIDSVTTIRLGTRTLTWWPYRFITDEDAEELLEVFDHIISKGRHIGVMAHISHPRELMTESVQKAIRRIRSTGAVIRCQCPIVKDVNDTKDVWTGLLTQEIRLGLIPYYMFIDSCTPSGTIGNVSLASALGICREAQQEISGLAKTLCGPVMTTASFKILVEGTTVIENERVFVLKIIQSVDFLQKGTVFFARYDSNAHDFTQLKPVFGRDRIYFQ